MNEKSVFLFFVLIILFTNTGCFKKATQTNHKSEVVNKLEDTHKTQVSSAWEGTYFGVLPCDGCPGINRMITLYGDRSFKEVTEVINSGDKPITKVGKALWSKDRKSVVCAGSTYKVKVTENTLFIEYINDQKGNHAVLSKIDFSFDTKNKIGFVFEEFTGDDDKHYKLLFNTN